jgi:CheY-like chemotaxis protein
MSIRVLLADDQVPWDDAALDDRVRSEIVAEKGEELRKKGKDPLVVYEEDKVWFKQLIHYLCVKQGYTVTFARQFEDADRQISERNSFDVIVIDLSWTGDSKLPRGQRSNVGLKLIKAVTERNPDIPVIAFSQNFESDSELMGLVTKQNGFPLQKHYSQLDFQALASAIAYMTRNSRPAGGEAGTTASSVGVGKTFWDVLSTLPRVAIPIALAIVLIAVWGFAHVNTPPGDSVKAFGIPLYTKLGRCPRLTSNIRLERRGFPYSNN